MLCLYGNRCAIGTIITFLAANPEIVRMERILCMELLKFTATVWFKNCGNTALHVLRSEIGEPTKTCKLVISKF